MRILLVRHGESLSNIDNEIYKNTAEHDIALTERGLEQAEYVGEFLKAYFEKEFGDILDPDKSDEEKTKASLNNMMKSEGFNSELGEVLGNLFSNLSEKFNNSKDLQHAFAPRIKMYNSPYRRARQTSQAIKNVMGGLFTSCQEDVLLGEQSYGNHNGLESDEYLTFFPKEAECYNQVKNSPGGKLFARAGQGESGLDVIIRLKLFIMQLKEDSLEEGINDFIVVCHGNTMKLFTMAFCNFDPEWYDGEKTPGNCSVRLLDNKVDSGYIFGGWKQGKKV